MDNSIKQKNVVDHFPHIFDNDLDKLREYLKTIMPKNHSGLNINAFIGGGKNSIINRCEIIRENYRNNAAHTNRIDRFTAENCCNDIIGPEEASANFNAIQGVLFEILKYTSEFKKNN